MEYYKLRPCYYRKDGQVHPDGIFIAWLKNDSNQYCSMVWTGKKLIYPEAKNTGFITQHFPKKPGEVIVIEWAENKSKSYFELFDTIMAGTMESRIEYLLGKIEKYSAFKRVVPR